MKRLPMRKIRDALRLQAAGLSKRQIAVSLGVGRTSAREYLERAQHAGLSWPLPGELTDEALKERLSPAPQTGQTKEWPRPDWPAIHRERRRPGVTLMLLWEEYRGVHPDGYGYSQFCQLYRRWKGRLSPTMRQTHLAGDKMFVDYAGQTIEIMDGLTGEMHDAQLFVAVLGASSYTYAEATLTQSLPDWTGSHCRAFSFFGGVTAQVVSDNLKSPKPVFMNRRSIGLIPTWQTITTRRSCRPGPTSPATRPKSRSPYRSPNAESSSHRRYADWTPDRLKRKAYEVGPDTGALVDVIMREHRHPKWPHGRYRPPDASCPPGGTPWTSGNRGSG